MIKQHENYVGCPYYQAATKTEDLVLAEVVYKNNGDSTKDEKEVGHWGNGEDKKETKITPKDVEETSYGSNEEVNKQTQVTEKRSEVVLRNAMEKK
jgi:isopentenyldiphosphate isomerase